MFTKRLLILLVATVFILGLASIGLSAGAGKEVTGTVTKIEDSKLTIVDDMGKEKTVKVKDQEILKEIKVGDRVSVKDGMMTKEGAGSSAPSPSSKY